MCVCGGGGQRAHNFGMRFESQIYNPPLLALYHA
jgi:hypothetical protein